MIALYVMMSGLAEKNWKGKKIRLVPDYTTYDSFLNSRFFLAVQNGMDFLSLFTSLQSGREKKFTHDMHFFVAFAFYSLLELCNTLFCARIQGCFPLAGSVE